MYKIARTLHFAIRKGLRGVNKMASTTFAKEGEIDPIFVKPPVPPLSKEVVLKLEDDFHGLINHKWSSFIERYNNREDSDGHKFSYPDLAEHIENAWSRGIMNQGWAFHQRKPGTYWEHQLLAAEYHAVPGYFGGVNYCFIKRDPENSDEICLLTSSFSRMDESLHQIHHITEDGIFLLCDDEVKYDFPGQKIEIKKET